MTNELLSKSLAELKKRIDLSGGDLLIQDSDGEVEPAQFRFNPPATQEDIEELEYTYDVELPQDYVDFLKIHNGAVLFDRGRGEYTELYSISQVYEFANVGIPEVSPGFMPIARHPSCEIFIDTSRKKRYMFTNICSPDFNYLNLDFAEWLSRLIVANGEDFWEWTPLLLYRTIDDEELQIKDWIIRGLTSQ